MYGMFEHDWSEESPGLGFPHDMHSHLTVSELTCLREPKVPIATPLPPTIYPQEDSQTLLDSELQSATAIFPALFVFGNLVPFKIIIGGCLLPSVPLACIDEFRSFSLAAFLQEHFQFL